MNHESPAYSPDIEKQTPSPAKNNEEGIENVLEDLTRNTKDQAPISRRRVLACMGAAALTLLLERSGLEAMTLPEKKESDREFDSGLNYSSEKTRESLQGYERFYPDLKDSKTPVIIATFDDIMKNLPDEEKEMLRFKYGAVAAFTINPEDHTETFVNRLGLQKNAIYIQFNDIALIKPDSMYGTVFHEGRHAKHMSGFREDGKHKSAEMTYDNKVNAEANLMLEELTTNEETIKFLIIQKSKPEKSILTDAERQHLDEVLKGEMIYARDNYFRYYWAKYGKGYNVPCGERKMNDRTDKLVEKIWEKCSLKSVMGEKENTFLQMNIGG